MVILKYVQEGLEVQRHRILHVRHKGIVHAHRDETPMSEILPNNDSAENEITTETPSTEPSFFQKNKLVVSAVSGVLVVALGVGGFLFLRPSPAQPYLDKVCAAFNGLKISETSNTEAEALISAQESNIELANSLDPDASMQVNEAFEDFKTYEQKVSTTNLRFAIAVTLKNIASLSEISKQIDIDSAYGKSAVESMDTACGR